VHQSLNLWLQKQNIIKVAHWYADERIGSSFLLLKEKKNRTSSQRCRHEKYKAGIQRINNLQ
jgi:hypothetical protein